MQIVRETTGNSTTRLHEIMHDFTPPMRRVCPHLSDGELLAMIERMARHKLEEESTRLRQARRSRNGSPRPRGAPERRTMLLVS